MIIKAREEPELLSLLPRLLKRLPEEHSAHLKVFQHLRSIGAGFHGETKIDEVVERMPWNIPVFILQDLNFQTGLMRCQVDTLILTPYYALVLEVKNFSGTLNFQEQSYQMTRITREGLEEGFDSPVAQLNRAVREVEYLLKRCELPLPIHKAVVLPYPSTIVKGVPGVPIVFSKSLPYFISSLPTLNSLTEEPALLRTAEKLASLHLPFYLPDFRKRYGFQLEDFRTGVICSKCRRTAERKSSRSHHCFSCGTTILDGHTRALQDWRCFVSPQITSAECRRFLGLADKDATYHILKKEATQVKRGIWEING